MNEEETNEKPIVTASAAAAALVDWIRGAGGEVHESLVLTEQDGMRGISCRNTISKGELLIRLPASLALSGKDMPRTYARNQNDDDDNGASKHASPWLRCLAAFYQARTAPDSKYRAYLDSLPSDYEHLFQWTNEQVEQDLKGTTLGRIVSQDRSEGTLEKRYLTSIRPYLNFCNVLRQYPQKQQQQGDNSNSDPTSNTMEEQAFFRNACMCLSTRGFHLDALNQETDYSGPFLLPFIDLMNHNPERSCTTLKRDDGATANKTNACGHFYIIAERNIQKGEQLYHSYGNALTSAQVLQTFGFVPDDSICRAAMMQEGNDNNNVVRVASPYSRSSSIMTAITPAIISRDNIIQACRELVRSGYPTVLQDYIRDHDLQVETWNMTEAIANRDCSAFAQVLSDDIPVSYCINCNAVEKDVSVNDARVSPLSDELVTACTLQLLPTDVYQEFMSDSPSLLDASVLQDYYLGKLVCKTLLILIENQKREYGYCRITSSNGKLSFSSVNEQHTGTVDTANEQRDNNPNRLLQLYRESKQRSTTLSNDDLRYMYGLTIRNEEMSCLDRLRSTVLELMDSLDDDKEDEEEEEGIINDDAGDNCGSGKRKRPYP